MVGEVQAGASVDALEAVRIGEHDVACEALDEADIEILDWPGAHADGVAPEAPDWREVALAPNESGRVRLGPASRGPGAGSGRAGVGARDDAHAEVLRAA